MKNALLARAALIAAIGSAAAGSTAALSATTGFTGSGTPFDNMQPSLAVTEATPLSGIFPSGGGGGSAIGDTLGFIYDFAGNFAPGSSLLAGGQTLPINQNQALFSLLGTTYGGNGTTNFNLPNLTGQATMGVGTGSGLTTRTLGVGVGSATTSLTVNQIPSHNHTVPSGGVTGFTGGGQAFNNVQPSLPLHRLIAIGGIFPSQGGGSGSSTFLGQIATFAGNFVPSGWADADGSILQINQNQALFALLGTTYGGNGTTNFALPDLRGRVAVGVDATHPLGSTSGQESTILTLGQLPSHDHTLPGGGVTGNTGGGLPVNNVQPSLALNYIIATSGIFPTRGGGGGGFDTTDPVLGQIAEFAGNFAPSGWALADGQLLSIAANTALFSVIGTQFGGDGVQTFALPDFRDRTMIGADDVNFFVGDVLGGDTNTLTVADLPSHDHTLADAAVPEPATLSLLGLGFAGLLAARRRTRR